MSNIFLKKDFLNFTLLNNGWSFLSKNLNFSEICPGKVFKVSFIVCSSNEVQYKTFVGICLSKSFGSYSFVLRNFFKIDSIEMRFFFKSPTVLSIECLKQYKRKTKLSKLYFLRQLRRKTYKS